MPLLFSYGTLQQEDVQQSTFGRRLKGERDELPRFEPSAVRIEDPRVAADSGRTHHANVTFTGRDDTRVSGTVFDITDAELASADRYETRAAYTRIAVMLASGRQAWVYLDARSRGAKDDRTPMRPPSGAVASVRPEQPGDEAAIAAVNDAAFGGSDESRIVDSIRRAGAAALSLVATDAAGVVGHILFTPVGVSPPGSAARVVALGPMAVVPARQRQGIGSLLVREGLEACRRGGWQAAVVVGHPGYYPRFGFRPASLYGLRCEYDVPDEVFMAIELAPGALNPLPGIVRYRREFSPESSAPGVMHITAIETRVAHAGDVDAIARAHVDSIRSIGPAFYPPHVVDDWAEGLRGEVYLAAMEGGEVFFVATGRVDEAPTVLGFASDYRIEGSTHGTSVYVRGVAARRGIGSALLRLAEAHAVAAGATQVRVEASLAGVEFYRANGFVESGRGETRLPSGRPIASVFMRKDLAAAAASHAPGGG